MCQTYETERGSVKQIDNYQCDDITSKTGFLFKDGMAMQYK
jgi:hypothetical protein